MVGRRVSLNCFKDREVVGIGGEWDAARVRPYADGLLDKTETMVHFERVVGRASRRACRFDPEPEIRTVTLQFRGEVVFGDEDKGEVLVSAGVG